jgi:hypothetical protein
MPVAVRLSQYMVVSPFRSRLIKTANYDLLIFKPIDTCRENLRYFRQFFYRTG